MIMKRILSIILTLTMFMSVLSPCRSVIAAEIGKANALTVGNEIAEMCAKYDGGYENTDDSNPAEEKTIGTRLIVETNDRMDEYGAVDSVYGLGYAFLQYADEKAAQAAKKQYERANYIVNYDSLITANAATPYVNQSNKWAYEETGAVSAVDYYKYKINPRIKVALLGYGINYNHDLFKNRVVRTYADFSTDDTGSEMERFSNGTTDAGVIAMSTPGNVKLYSYKVINSEGKSSYSIMLSAIEYIKQLVDKPDILQCSFNASHLTGAIIDELVDMGITVVAPAGDEYEEAYEEPEQFANVITVAGMTQYGKRYSRSNYGPGVDISAPAERVYTAYNRDNYSYAFFNSTAFAASFVTAAAAIVLMENRDFTPEQVKQELIATAIPFKKSDYFTDHYFDGIASDRLGVGMVNLSNIIKGRRCDAVTANCPGGVYHLDIGVELKCDSPRTDIYYTTDGTLPTETNGTKYTEPIAVTESTRIIAAAFARAGTPMHSKFTVLDYYVLKNIEDEYIMNNDGVVMKYLGDAADVIVPESINGIAITEIGEKCFAGSNVENVVLPDTVISIGEGAFYNTDLKSITANGVIQILKQSFYGCDKLADVELPKLRFVGEECLYGCKSLTGDLEIPSLERVGERAFTGTYFDSIKLPNCTEALDYAFENCTAQDIVLHNLTSLGEQAFAGCKNLEVLYVPKLTGLGETLKDCTGLKTIFAPMMETFIDTIPSNVTVYCSSRLTNVILWRKFGGHKYTFVSPEYTPGLSLAGDDVYADSLIHIDSDRFAQSKGAQIRPRDSAIRFGFSFDESDVGFDFKKYADNIDYGFIYTYQSYAGESDYQINERFRVNNNTEIYKKAVDNGMIDGTATYNAVFTDISASDYADEITARAYVCIDGMYFYSPVMTRSFGDVATKVIADDEIDRITKDKVNALLNIRV